MRSPIFSSGGTGFACQSGQLGFLHPRSLRLCVELSVLLTLCAAAMSAQTCACGANPPGPPPNRELRPYANAPEDMRPYSKFTVPYYEHYGKLVEYNGGARDVPTLKPEEVDEVRIGFLGPVENHPDQRLGSADASRRTARH